MAFARACLHGVRSDDPTCSLLAVAVFGNIQGRIPIAFQGKKGIFLLARVLASDPDDHRVRRDEGSSESALARGMGDELPFAELTLTRNL